MIFVINALKYDTTKMELITTKCEYKYVRTMLSGIKTRLKMDRLNAR